MTAAAECPGEEEPPAGGPLQPTGIFPPGRGQRVCVTVTVMITQAAGPGLTVTLSLSFKSSWVQFAPKENVTT